MISLVLTYILIRMKIKKHETRIEMGMKLVKESHIEDMLDEADTEAKNNQERLSHDEVFKAIRSSLKDTTSNH